MADPADLVREACTLLAGYLPVLERLLAEPDALGAPLGGATRVGAPLPGNAAAFYALMGAWEGVPRLEAALRYALNGHPGMRRGGSPGNFAAALDAVPKLAAGLDEDAEAASARYIERLINEIRCVRAIDEAQQWRPLPGRACPYCKCYTLKVVLDAAGRPTERVECCTGRVTRDGATVRCADGNGYRPTATLCTDAHGRPVLAWADGFTETAPDMEG